MARRSYSFFSHKGANFRIACSRLSAVTSEIIFQRMVLEHYISANPLFQAALSPVPVSESAPPIARRMSEAAKCVGVGPMAAVAGAMAEAAAKAGLRAGASEAIVDNGGDIYIAAAEPVVIGIFSGSPNLADSLAFRIEPEETPLAICSSSGCMGRSFSFGSADLACVIAWDASLADAAATFACNLVHSPDDIAATLERVAVIRGVRGAVVIKDDRIGLVGRLPRLVRQRDGIPPDFVTGL